LGSGQDALVTVDAHVHLLPIRLGQAIRTFFAEHGVGWETWRYPIDPGEALRLVAAEGITSVWSLPYARRPGTAPALNQSSAETAAGQAGGPVEVVGGATVHPGDTDPAGIVRLGVEEYGLRVLKLHCSVGDYEPDDPRLDPVWSYVSDVRLPVVIHAGHDVTGETSASEVDAVGVVAERWPEARVIIAHFGHHAGDSTLDLLESHPNVHADLTPVIRDPVPLPTARLAAVADRVLFGSDCPNTALTVTELLARVDHLGLDTTAVAGIRGDNARRLQAEIKV
jgi:predicted TIM-barrel fold metal-dependent hydrolase